MKIMVSACLLGENCKYNGGNNYSAAVVEYVKDREVLPVCPEMQAGLGCPRIPMEIVDGVLTDREGNNVDEAVRRAVAQVLETARRENVQFAVLKARSPTCGVEEVYDGTFSGKRIPGSGVLTQALMAAGIRAVDEEMVEAGVKPAL